MKTISLSLLVVVIAFTFSNCNGNKKADTQVTESVAVETSTSEEVASQPQFTVDPDFQQQLAAAFKSYVVLKEAFVSSDAAKVSAEATNTSKSLNGVDMKLLTGAAHNDWMSYLAGMETALKTMMASTDIEAQREALSSLTENLYKSIKAFGLGGATAYYEFCPMAFNDQGGYWLSDAAEIRNPYFGDKMLKCGNVAETLK